MVSGAKRKWHLSFFIIFDLFSMCLKVFKKNYAQPMLDFLYWVTFRLSFTPRKIWICLDMNFNQLIFWLWQFISAAHATVSHKSCKADCEVLGKIYLRLVMKTVMTLKLILHHLVLKWYSFLILLNLREKKTNKLRKMCVSKLSTNTENSACEFVRNFLNLALFLRNSLERGYSIIWTE